jgi:hypothetical protein
MNIVDALTLSEEHRKLLRPDEELTDRVGRVHRLPRYFYEIGSWKRRKRQSSRCTFRSRS